MKIYLIMVLTVLLQIQLPALDSLDMTIERSLTELQQGNLAAAKKQFRRYFHTQLHLLEHQPEYTVDIQQLSERLETIIAESAAEQQTAGVVMLAGVKFLQQQSSDEVIQLLDLAVSLGDRSADLSYLYALHFWGRYNQAKSRFERAGALHAVEGSLSEAIEREPAYHVLYRLRAQVHLLNKQPAAAEADFLKANEIVFAE